MHVKILILFILYGSVPKNTKAQYYDYAKEVVHILASDTLHGRGYLHNGDGKAASFIKNELEKIGVKAINESYFQEFDLSINTFPDSIFLSIDNENFLVGEDFHVHPGAPSINGKFEFIFIGKDEIFDPHLLSRKISKSKGKILVLQEYPDSLLDETKRKQLQQLEQFLTLHPQNPAAASIILTSKKLTWYASTFQSAIPSIYLKKEYFDPSSKFITLNISNRYIARYRTQNVLGLIEGKHPDSLIVIMAHYDHFGMMGQAIFPGANDNASGVAMLLSLASYYSANKPKFSMVFVAFGAEEAGLRGSKYFVDHSPIDLSAIKFVLNFDLAGTGDEGIQVVNGSVYTYQFNRLRELNQKYNLLPEVKIRGAACNSDHCNFDRVGIPGFYIYTLGGINAYHDIYDRAETLPLTEFDDYFRLITLFLDSM